MTEQPDMAQPDLELQSAPRRPRVGPMLVNRILLPAVGAVALIAIWELTVQVNDLETIVMPRPTEVLESLNELVRDSAFWHDVRISVWEFTSGYLLGVILGVFVGMLMGEHPIVRMILHPVVESFRFIVPFAWIPLAVLWFGTSLLGKTLLVAYAVFFVMVVSTTRSIDQLDPTLSKVGTMLGMGRWRLAFAVHLRAAAPSIASAARAAAAIGWIAVVAAEYIGASAGLGVLIINASTSLQTTVVIAGMLIIGLVGAAVSALVKWISRVYLSYL